jgi:zinc protease
MMGNFMTMLRRLTLALALTTSLVAVPTAMAKGSEAAPIADLVKDIKLPYETFTLDNGLRVVVHEDRKAPVVAVSTWYRVGSKHEPAGKTGFAHLFEHLMFNGSENAPGDFFAPLQRAGATSLNGTTWYDRTNYFETVPTGALDLALFLESDRMGHFLGAVTQENLDNQRSVVQNEKRQGDNQPYGLLEYEIGETLLPKGHPYRHSTIGSMNDLTSATLGDAKAWFTDHYAPNNAVIGLAGDIDVATARVMVNKWFGDIPRGKAVAKVDTPIVSLPAAVYKELTDMVPGETVFRTWLAPGLLSADSGALLVGMQVLGGLSSSRLDNALVRKAAVAVETSASLQRHEDASFVSISAVAKDGVDAGTVAKLLDQEVAAFLQSGPTQDELDRAVTSYVASTLTELDTAGGFGGKAAVLAEATLYANDPAFYVKELNALAKLTPGDVKVAMNKWLGRPVFGLIYKPGERTSGGENRGGADFTNAITPTPSPAYYRNPNAAPVEAAPAQAVDRSKYPEVKDLAGLAFPNIERAKLLNGVEVVFARRTSVPVVYAAMSFDAGYAADPRNALGTQQLMLSLMNEGTKTLDSIKFAEAKERLGASISSSAVADNTIFTLSALKANLAPSLSLFADYIRNPAFAPAELERVRAQQVVSVRSELTNPASAAMRVFGPAAYGPNHPYGVPSSGLGTIVSVNAVTHEGVAQFHKNWIRPDTARIFVVGDTTLAEVTRALNADLGRWKPDGSQKPVKDFSVAIPKASSRILLVDRPNAPQSVVLAGRVLNLKGRETNEALSTANSILGGSFMSRLNTNLRETKGWSYGVRSGISGAKEQVSWYVSAPVQSDRTGESIAEIRKDISEFLSSKGASNDEMERTVSGNIRELPGRFETTESLLTALMTLDRYGRPDDYYTKLPATYRAMKASDADREARQNLKVDDLIYVVVGDAKSVRPQLEALDLPIETVSLSN